MGLAACVGGWAARAPGPARACLNNLVVADIVRMFVSTFAFTFTAFCKRTSLFGTYHRCCTALRRPKNARSTAAVNLTRQIATWCVAATITVGRRGLGGGLGRRGRHEFGSLTRSSAVAQRSDHGCLPPTSTAHPATLADHEELGCNTATKYAFDAPLFVLARSSDDCHVAACVGVLQMLCWHARAFVCVRGTTFPACTDVVRRVSSCSGRTASRCASSARLLRAPPIILPKQKPHPK